MVTHSPLAVPANVLQFQPLCKLVLLLTLLVECLGTEWHSKAGFVRLNVSLSVEAQFTPSNRSRLLNHLAIDPQTDDLYVGAVNRLYQLQGADLSPIYQVITGPRLDSPKCHASNCDQNVQKVATDNHNKVLVVAGADESVIACGSVSQGACDKYRLGNLSLHLDYIPKAIAANDPHSSTYAFVGPYRYEAWKGNQALYVGTTFTAVGDYRNDVPAIATRNLHDLEVAEYSFPKHSLLRIDSKHRDYFLVQYVYGFNASDYMYFLTVQKKSHLPGQEEMGYITRMSRTCISDANYDSYTEISLECVGSNNVTYNLIQDAKLIEPGSTLATQMNLYPNSPILLAVFSPAVGHTSKPKQQSALCIYSVKEIEDKFNENIHMCFNGTMKYRNMEYIFGPIEGGKCPRQWTMGNILNFCEVGLKISGPVAMHTTAALHMPNDLITAVQGTATASHTVAFLGTSRGTLKKVLVSSWSVASEYEEIDVDSGYKILPDIKFNRNKSHLYVISESKVSKVKVENCARYENCSQCLRVADPYCGWCSLEKRCTVQSACQKASFSSPRWLSFGAGQQCIDFEMIRPDRLPMDQTDTVALTIKTLPMLPTGAKYQCMWGSAPPIDATMTRLKGVTGLKCSTPHFKHRPSIAVHKDHVLVRLSVRSSETNKDFVSRNFAFYDCSHHSTCVSCVRSAWACNWCVYENKCTQNASTCHNNIISGENSAMNLAAHGASYCPRFWRGSSELLAADEAQTKIVLLTENLPVPGPGQKGFQCVVSIEGATMAVDAEVMKATSVSDMWRNRTIRDRGSTQALQKVVCDATVYRYESPLGEYVAKLTLVWNADHTIDTRSLTLYKCHMLAAYRGHQDCSLCVTRPTKYSCSWCGSTCKYEPSCSASPAQAVVHSAILAEHNTRTTLPGQCPTPRIDVIQPLAGPLEGGTLITIEGSNLGLNKQDIENRVFVGHIPCQVQDYDVSVRITCTTGPVAERDSTKSNSLQYRVTITTPTGTTQSTVKFTYNNIKVYEVLPSRGPSSGGTTISINGEFLNVGSNVTVLFDQLPCTTNRSQSSSQRLVCVTSRANDSGSKLKSLPFVIKTITVMIDGAKRTLSSPYTYTPDPTILELKPLRSPWSGGRLLTVHGSYFDVIQSPKITVLYEDQVLNSSVCNVMSASKMHCPSPTVRKQHIASLIRTRRHTDAKSLSRLDRLPMSDSMRFDVGFIMDNVESLRNLRHYMHSSRASLVYVPDPDYRRFTGGIKLYKGDTLVIEGDALNLASDESDVNVTIGKMTCNVTSLALTQLVCTPPTSQPDATDETGQPSGQQWPLVVVRVGTSLRFPIGYLRYEMIKTYTVPPVAVGTIAGGALFLLLLSMSVLVVYKRKSSQAEREYKRIQIQMDTLESNVRSECKQAFAELQTDMTDMAADIESTGIPTLDERVYIMKVFFPGNYDHPILSDFKLLANGGRPSMDEAMVQFEQLLNNRYFLLTCIDVLESQKNFNMRDRTNVASLLVVSMCCRMEYLTEILRLLLIRLIDRNVETKYPQLMLRRTESVVEKMLTNWLALCMHQYLKEVAGPSLFLLQKAIKYQIEKGPVDAITHDARYSLSEERLLREQIDASYVTIAVIGDNNEKATCRALNCDTISQVKSKVLDALYRNTPFSMRPSIHDVDLEWRHGRNGHLVLADEDMTTAVDCSGWRKLNTLSHYGIEDSALMALVPRLASQTYANTETSDGTGTTLPRSTSLSPIAYSDNDHYHERAYHLVRPVDHDSPMKGSERNHKTVPEIFLTRLLSTKGTVQKYVNDFFRTILTANESLPPAVKWLYDFFDDTAKRFGVVDPDVVYAWKSNSLPLRFWVNFIKNPDFLLDIHKTPTVDSSLSVIAQTFMDACSLCDRRLGKDSPSNKLLFARDMDQYRTMVRLFYQRIRDLSPVTDQDMAAHLHQLSLHHITTIDTSSALHELFHSYVARYYPQIVQALELDPDCRGLHLSHKLDNIMCTLNGEPTSMC